MTVALSLAVNRGPRASRRRFLSRSFLQLPGEFFYALPHDFAGLKLHGRPRRNYETAARLIRVSTDAGFGQSRLEDSEVAQLDRHIVGQTIGDLIERPLDDIEDLMLDHPSLVANRYYNVAFGKFCHTF